MIVFTVGHSTRDIKEFIELIESHKIKQLIDIRTIPKSRHNPQFANENLKSSLYQAGIEYVYLPELGGLRRKTDNSENTGWRNKSFRNYADYMQTDEFLEGISRLIQLAKKSRSAIMCAEAVPWRCHRSLVGDALLVRNISVTDIISKTNTKEHALTPFAAVDGTKITYPAESR